MKVKKKLSFQPGNESLGTNGSTNDNNDSNHGHQTALISLIRRFVGRREPKRWPINLTQLQQFLRNGANLHQTLET